jgi:hypothetical protein
MTKSIETQPILINLALAVADALENPATPESLKEALSEVGSGLIDILGTGDIAPHLRALASLAQSGDGRTRPEAKSTPTGRFSAKNGAQNQGRQALAKASAIH